MVCTAATLVCIQNVFIVLKGSDNEITLPQECKIGVSSFENPNKCFVGQHAPGLHSCESEINNCKMTT